VWKRGTRISTWPRSRNDEIVKRVIALAGNYGIEPEHVQTDYFGVEPRYRDGYYEERDFIGYFVHKTIVITLHDLSGSRTCSRTRSSRRELCARHRLSHHRAAQATEMRPGRWPSKRAKEKAIALSGELGQNVGDPLTIQEEQSGWWSSYGALVGQPLGWRHDPERHPRSRGCVGAGDSSVAPRPDRGHRPGDGQALS